MKGSVDHCQQNSVDRALAVGRPLIVYVIKLQVAVPVLLLSAVGWLIFIVAFGWLNDNVYEEGTPG